MHTTPYTRKHAYTQKKTFFFQKEKKTVIKSKTTIWQCMNFMWINSSHNLKGIIKKLVSVRKGNEPASEKMRPNCNVESHVSTVHGLLTHLFWNEKGCAWQTKQGNNSLQTFTAQIILNLNADLISAFQSIEFQIASGLPPAYLTLLHLLEGVSQPSHILEILLIWANTRKSLKLNKRKKLYRVWKNLIAFISLFFPWWFFC